MRNISTIITDLKHNIEWSQPNMRYNNLMELVLELEQALNPKVTEIFTPVPAVEIIPTVEEKIEINEELSMTESIQVETPTVEETVAPKKGRKPSTSI